MEARVHRIDELTKNVEICHYPTIPENTREYRGTFLSHSIPRIGSWTPYTKSFRFGSREEANKHRTEHDVLETIQWTRAVLSRPLHVEGFSQLRSRPVEARKNGMDGVLPSSYSTFIRPLVCTSTPSPGRAIESLFRFSPSPARFLDSPPLRGLCETNADRLRVATFLRFEV